ncbi:MAG: nucleotide exchange factor GrpE [Acidobacteria bacterium 21-70-11]|nr:MAG: nucleotide exchange factor GrpE [Acidobacteria bacterium 21-70-11]OYW07001.1 MAG: nucleotide exchange factor GrpE [Acidobacteria bacterium 37-71-11]HQT93481.1 nucleotide exchange factor GrpE [Thermoanaerobaculaceae bacterium]HQU32701.1 nucleotide exchange factor GrpE [Thermoanaerobaculaceae bacterium]
MSDEERRQAPEEEAETGIEPVEGAGQQTEEAPLPDKDALQEELANLQQEIARFRELYLRKLADFDNYRKRQEREMGEFRRYANAELLRDCLPVLDNLERALAVPGGAASGLREGVELVLRQFKDVLGRNGLAEVDPTGQPFNPTLHEAISRNEDSRVQEPTVVQVLQKGYRLGERLIRPALVIVAVPAGPVRQADAGQSSEGTNGQNHRS